MIKMLKKIRNEDGFTLLEMAIVILIIAALLLIIIPNVSGVQESVDSTTGEAIITTVETQKMLYVMDNPGKKVEDVTINELHTAGYLSDKQYEAYTGETLGD